MQCFTLTSYLSNVRLVIRLPYIKWPKVCVCVRLIADQVFRKLTHVEIKNDDECQMGHKWEQRMCDWIIYVEPLQWWNKWLVLWNIHYLAHSQWVLRHFASNILSDRHQLVNSLCCCRWQWMFTFIPKASPDEWCHQSNRFVHNIDPKRSCHTFLSKSTPFTIATRFELSPIGGCIVNEYIVDAVCAVYAVLYIHIFVRSIYLSLSMHSGLKKLLWRHIWYRLVDLHFLLFFFIHTAKYLVKSTNSKNRRHMQFAYVTMLFVVYIFAAYICFFLSVLENLLSANYFWQPIWRQSHTST